MKEIRKVLNLALEKFGAKLGVTKVAISRIEKGVNSLTDQMAKAIYRDLTQKQKAFVLAEEIGHYKTNTGNILDQSNTGNQEQEYQARLYGYNLKVGLMGIVQAYEAGCRNLHETAELLDVTEAYLIEVLDTYRRKCGCGTEFDNYIVMFELYLAVIRKSE